MPVFGFYIPLYSFWHFDDFTWGTTRIVEADNDDEDDEVVTQSNLACRTYELERRRRIFEEFGDCSIGKVCYILLQVRSGLSHLRT